MKDTLRLALIQTTCDASAQDNLAALSNEIIRARQQGAQLVVLPELHNHPYFCQNENPDYFDLAESIPGPTTDSLGKLAREQQIVIVASLFERRASGLFHNTAVVIDTDGSIAGRYRKMHIPDDPGYYEKFYFTPGDLGFQPISTSVGKLGILVCWDQWFPEAARLMRLAGADILIYPTAIGWEPNDDSAEQQRQLDAWQTVQRGHAVANNIPVCACNRVGVESNPEDPQQRIEFWGHSFICGAQGEFLAHADTQQSAMLIADIDYAKVEAVRRIWPYLRDRRIEDYADLQKRYRD